MNWRSRLGRVLPTVLAASALAVGVVEFQAMVARGARDGLVDLTLYRDAVAGAVQGQSLYTFVSSRPEMLGQGFLYPPFAAVLFIPLTALSAPSAAGLWTAVSLVAVALLAAAVGRSMAGRGSRGEPVERAQWATWSTVAALVLVSSWPVVNNLISGQVSLLVAAACFLDAGGFVPRPFRGLLVGVAAAVKPTALVFVPFYAVTHQWRQLAISSAAFVACSGLGAIVFPGDSAAFWSRYVVLGLRGGDPAGFDNRSLLALLLRAGVHGEVLAGVLIVASLVVAAVALWQARILALRGQDARAAVVVGSLGAVLSPLSWSHHQVPVVLAGLLLVAGGTTASRVVGILVLLVLSLPVLALEVAMDPAVMAPPTWVAELPLVAALSVCLLGLRSMAQPREVD